MNFNSILIGSDDPERLAAYYTKLWVNRCSGRRFQRVADRHGRADGRGAFRGPREEPKPRPADLEHRGRDVKGVFERFQAAGAIVVKAPYEFEFKSLQARRSRPSRILTATTSSSRPPDGDVAPEIRQRGTPITACSSVSCVFDASNGNAASTTTSRRARRRPDPIDLARPEAEADRAVRRSPQDQLTTVAGAEVEGAGNQDLEAPGRDPPSVAGAGLVAIGAMEEFEKKGVWLGS